MNNNIIEINEEKIKDHRGNFGRETMEETLNAMLGAEADQLCKAQNTSKMVNARDIALATTKAISIQEPATCN